MFSCTTRWIYGAALGTVLLSSTLGAPAAFADPVLKAGDIVAVCGDSITAQRIYSAYIEEYLLMCQPARGVKAMEAGWGGSTASAFAGHMTTDVLTLSPTVATVCFGMNDANYNGPDATIDQNYRDSLTKVIANFKKSGTRTIIIGSPGIVDAFYFKNPKHHDISAVTVNQSLGRLSEIGKQVAASSGVIFADLHTPMMDAMTKAKAQLGDQYPVAGDVDGVHGGPNDHLMMAYGFLKAMGFDGNIGTITYDDANGSATGSDGHKIVSSKPGQIVVESTRYPFCFFNGYKDANLDSAVVSPVSSWNYGNVSILPYIPFNEDLNRYILIVKNLKQPRAKVTWGEQSKEFTSDQLAHGINLAAEFLKNPFVQPFMAVSKAVISQQEFDAEFITTHLYNEPSFLRANPAKGAAFKSLDAAFQDIQAGYQDNCAQLVKPVTHTIKIEPLP